MKVIYKILITILIPVIITLVLWLIGKAAGLLNLDVLLNFDTNSITETSLLGSVCIALLFTVYGFFYLCWVIAGSIVENKDDY